MGRVSAFLGMVLYMYPEKNGRHNRPHVHVIYNVSFPFRKVTCLLG